MGAALNAVHDRVTTCGRELALTVRVKNIESSAAIYCSRFAGDQVRMAAARGAGSRAGAAHCASATILALLLLLDHFFHVFAIYVVQLLGFEVRGHVLDKAFRQVQLFFRADGFRGGLAVVSCRPIGVAWATPTLRHARILPTSLPTT
jgi:hypothetical protein